MLFFFIKFKLYYKNININIIISRFNLPFNLIPLISLYKLIPIKKKAYFLGK